MMPAILGIVAVIWTALLAAFCLAFIASSLRVMVDSYYSDHVIAYVRENPNDHWVKTMLVSFVGLVILLALGFTGLALVP